MDKNGMEKIRIGIVGCGGIYHQKHEPNLKKFGELCEVTAVCDIVEERALDAAKTWNLNKSRVFVDYRKLLELDDVDAVYVLTPNVAHRPITVDAFSAGKHLFCEKPMAHTSEDAQAMIGAWKKSGKKFTIGYQNRFRPEVQMLKKSCDQGELGEIYYAKAHAIRRRAVPTWGVFPNKALQGGGPLIDIGTHALDLTLWMMNNYEPVSVTGSVFYKLGGLPDAVEGNMFGPWDPKTYEVEDSAFGMIKMKDGAAINLEASWAINMRESREASTTLCGTRAGAEIMSGMSYPKDVLILNRGHNGLLTEENLSGSGNVAYFSGNMSDPGFFEAKQWLEAILYNREPLVNPGQALTVTMILDAIYRSSETGKEILL
jgi:predicted dehydrogenase